ncbi:AzlC family ABC transporter permease [Lapillicoccus jejuensis]|uniref:Putative branched-subunit amino acid permease n=1 Tax=Lapillicoccus jejuensis TaxID=402171 RepID=A0A542E3V5_9MICO|nr:AzlC family ABC transporter permease [Lapillicoccus jejuensis]TQJ10028.1 putative branched-subunit amino acid permease [Lapillicoccus jejuensis]
MRRVSEGGDDAPARTARRAVTRQAVSVGLATSAYGVSFGALSVASGLDVWQTCVLSLLLFSGGSQFAFAGIVGAGGSGVAAVATSSLLGVRNGLYGLQVARLLHAHGPRVLLAAHLTIDESTAVAVGQREPSAQRRGFWLTGALVLLGWNLTTLLGAVLGDALGDPRTYGFDAAAAAAFLALLWPRLRSREAAATGVAAAVVAALLSPVTPPGVPVLVAALAAVAVGWWGRRTGAGPVGDEPEGTA